MQAFYSRLFPFRVEADDRACYVCRHHIPAPEGIAWAFLGVLTHRDTCADVVRLTLRDYSRSPRGRWNSRRRVLGLIERYRAWRAEYQRIGEANV